MLTTDLRRDPAIAFMRRRFPRSAPRWREPRRSPDDDGGANGRKPSSMRSCSSSFRGSWSSSATPPLSAGASPPPKSGARVGECSHGVSIPIAIVSVHRRLAASVASSAWAPTNLLSVPVDVWTEHPKLCWKPGSASLHLAFDSRRGNPWLRHGDAHQHVPRR